MAPPPPPVSQVALHVVLGVKPVVGQTALRLAAAGAIAVAVALEDLVAGCRVLRALRRGLRCDRVDAAEFTLSRVQQVASPHSFTKPSLLLPPPVPPSCRRFPSRRPCRSCRRFRSCRPYHSPTGPVHAAGAWLAAGSTAPPVPLFVPPVPVTPPETRVESSVEAGTLPPPPRTGAARARVERAAAASGSYRRRSRRYRARRLPGVPPARVPIVKPPPRKFLEPAGVGASPPVPDARTTRRNPTLPRSRCRRRYRRHRRCRCRR